MSLRVHVLLLALSLVGAATLLGTGARGAFAEEPAPVAEADVAAARELLDAARAALRARDGAAYLARLAPSLREEVLGAARALLEEWRQRPDAAERARRELGLTGDPRELTPVELAGRLLASTLTGEGAVERALEPLGTELLGVRRDGGRLTAMVRSAPGSWLRRADGTHELLLVGEGAGWRLDLRGTADRASAVVERLRLASGAAWLEGVLPDGATLVARTADEAPGGLWLAPFRREGPVRHWSFGPAEVRRLAIDPRRGNLLIAFENMPAEDEDEDAPSDYVAWFRPADGSESYLQEMEAAQLGVSADGLMALVVAPASPHVSFTRTVWTPGLKTLWSSASAPVAAAAWLGAREEVVARTAEGELVVVGVDGKERRRWKPAVARPTLLAVHPQEPWVGVAGDGSDALVLDVREGRTLLRLPAARTPDALLFSPDGLELAVATGGRVVRHRVRDGAQLGEHRAMGAFQGLCWHPTQPLLLAGVVAAGGEFDVWVFSTAALAPPADRPR